LNKLSQDDKVGAGTISIAATFSRRIILGQLVS
jgi:hypothetical protein